MSTANFSVIAAGAVVQLHGITDGPEMVVLACDRSVADCVWFNRNADLVRERFPVWALKRVNDRSRDSGELAALNSR